MEHESPSTRAVYDELMNQIINHATVVHQKIGPGRREEIYQRELETHLSEAGMPFEAQKPFAVFDRLHPEACIGYYLPDFVVDGKIIVEIKSGRELDRSQVLQVHSYLDASGCKLGLLIHFGGSALQYRKVYPPKHRIDFIYHQWLYVPESLKTKK